MASYGDAGSYATGVYWGILLVFCPVSLVGTDAALRSSLRRGGH